MQIVLIIAGTVAVSLIFVGSPAFARAFLHLLRSKMILANEIARLKAANTAAVQTITNLRAENATLKGQLAGAATPEDVAAAGQEVDAVSTSLEAATIE